MRNAVSGNMQMPGGIGVMRGMPTPNTINAGAGGGAAGNPFQPNSALWFLRNIAQSGQQTAANTGITAGTIHIPGGLPPQPPNMAGGPPNWGGGGPGQRPPGGAGRPNVPNFGWSPGGPGAPNVPPPWAYPPNGPPPPGNPPNSPAGTGGGGGRGGGIPIPFAGRAGFGSTAGLLTGAFGAAVVAKAVEEIALAPQTLGNVEMGALASAEPYNRIALGSTALGRAGGFRGMNLVGGIGAGKLTPPDWMSDLGLGPAEAMQLLQNFPITPRSVGQATGIIQGLGNLQFQPALSGLPRGQIEQFAGDAARYGQISPTRQGLESLGIILTDPLTKAVQMGLDRASILRSMDASLQSAASSGGSFGGISNVGKWMTSFADLPGGRTGEAALAAGAGISGALGSVTSLSNPGRVVAMSSWANKLQSEGDLKNLFDSTNGPGSWATYVQDPGNRAIADRYLRLRSTGQTPFAISALGDLMNSPGGEKVAARMFRDNPVANQYGNRDVNDLAAAHLAGMTPRQYDALQRSSASSALADYADRHGGVSASVLQATATVESNYDKNARSDAGAMGIMQLMPDTAREEGLVGGEVWDAEKNAKAGAHYLNKMTAMFHGDVRKGLEAYNWGPAHRREIDAGHVPREVVAYADNVMNRAEEIDRRNRPLTSDPSQDDMMSRSFHGSSSPTAAENTPHDILRGQAGARTAGIYGSSFSSAELNFILPAVNSGLSSVIEAARAFANSIDAANKSMDFHNSTAAGAGLMQVH